MDPSNPYLIILKLLLFIYLLISPSINQDFVKPLLSDAINRGLLLALLIIVALWDLALGLLLASLYAVWMLYVFHQRAKQLHHT